MSAPSFEIRRLTTDDAALYRDIRLEGLRLNPDAFGSTFASENARPLEAFVKRVRASEIFGAFRGAELLGITGLAFRAGIKEHHKAFLWGVYVRAEARGAGVARALAETALAAARKRVEIVQLTVESGNLGARHLYESLGFVEYGFEKKALKFEGRYADDIHMALDFSEQ